MFARSKLLLPILVAMAWVFGASCSERTETAPSATPTRIVVLDPGITEVMVDLGATALMVGRPDYTDSWESIRAIPTVGTGLTPNYEQIVRADPDLILSTSGRDMALSNLSAIAPTQNIPWLSAAEVADGIRAIGKTIGKAEPAEAMAARLQRGLAPTTGPDSPKTLVLLGAPSETATDLWYVKPTSVHGAAVAAAGLSNAMTAKNSGPPSISLEGLMRIDPELILVLIANMDTDDEAIAQYRKFWNRFPMLRAVKNDQIGFLVGQSHFSTALGVLAFKEALSAKAAQMKETGQ